MTFTERTARSLELAVEESVVPTPPSIWQGHQVRLRPVEPDDWSAFYAWDEDDESSRMVDRIPLPRSRAAARHWAEREATERSSGDAFRWVIVDSDGAFVGSINTHSCDPRVGSFAYGLGVLPQWQGRGYAAEAIRLVLRYYFVELGYQKVTVHVYEYNQPSQSLHQRLGFVQEGRLRRMVYADQRHWDTLVFGLTREEFAAHQAPKLPAFAPLTP